MLLLQLTVCLFCLASHDVGGAKSVVRLILLRCAADLAVSKTPRLLGPPAAAAPS